MDLSEITRITALFETDCEQWTKDDVDDIVKYMRFIRTNVKNAEATGKRITRKAATTGVAAPPDKESSALDSLVGQGNKSLETKAA